MPIYTERDHDEKERIQISMSTVTCQQSDSEGRCELQEGETRMSVKIKKSQKDGREGIVLATRSQRVNGTLCPPGLEAPPC